MGYGWSSVDKLSSILNALSQKVVGESTDGVVSLRVDKNCTKPESRRSLKPRFKAKPKIRGMGLFRADKNLLTKVVGGA